MYILKKREMLISFVNYLDFEGYNKSSIKIEDLEDGKLFLIHTIIIKYKYETSDILLILIKLSFKCLPPLSQKLHDVIYDQAPNSFNGIKDI